MTKFFKIIQAKKYCMENLKQRFEKYLKRKNLNIVKK